MKKILLIASLMACSAMAFADATKGEATQNTTVTTGSSAVSTSNGGAGGAGGSSTSSGNTSGNITVGCLVNCASTDQGSKDAAAAAVTVATINAGAAKEIAAINADARIKNTPSVNGPPLTSSNDTCMGSASGSVNAPGIGVSLGKTYTDANCVMLKNSRELWNMGMKAAALALMCKDADNREALELTGFECPQTTKARNGNMAVQQHAQASQEQYTDPIVRARLGLPPLTEAK